MPLLLFLHLYFWYTQQQAQGTTLGLMVLPIGFLAAWSYYQAGNIDIKAVAIMAVTFFIAGYFGGKMATTIDTSLMRKIFSVALILIARIVDPDIQAFFDSIDHTWMLRFLEHRIADRRLLRLIRKWLKVGVIEEGRRMAAETGTPQGAVISPLLANIYLHYVLDLWAHQWRHRHAAGQVIMVRYADDSVFGFEHKADAERFLADMRERMAQFGLALHPDKTRLIEFGRLAIKNRKQRGEGKPETFDFLGFTHCCSTTRKGGFKILRLTVKKRMRATLKAIREKLRSKLHDPVPEVGRWLGRVVQGYFNYFAVPGNAYRLCSFRYEVCRAWRRMLQRRSQRHNQSWERFGRLVKRYIPPFRNTHPYPELSLLIFDCQFVVRIPIVK